MVGGLCTAVMDRPLPLRRFFLLQLFQFQLFEGEKKDFPFHRPHSLIVELIPLLNSKSQDLSFIRPTQGWRAHGYRILSFIDCICFFSSLHFHPFAFLILGSYKMQFRSKAELENMDPIALLWEQYYVAEVMLRLEKRIHELNGEISLASAQLQEATRRRHTVIFPFEDKPRRESPVLRGLKQNLFEKYEHVKSVENTLVAFHEYCDLIRDILG